MTENEIATIVVNCCYQWHGIAVDEVCEHKPPALIYVDDRAVRFRGNWDDVLDEIRQFRK